MREFILVNENAPLKVHYSVKGLYKYLKNQKMTNAQVEKVMLEKYGYEVRR